MNLLIANRAEVAVRVARTAAELGFKTTGIFASDDAEARHVSAVDEAHDLESEGVAAYLDQSRILAIAKANQCTHVHPGWGFLSENAEFAARCEAEGIVFIGPTPSQLSAFADKVKARALANKCEVSVAQGSGPLANESDFNNFLATLPQGTVVILKATAGGGGRGMTVVDDVSRASDSFKRCQREALAAFGDGTLYAEQWIQRARHIEVQALGDGTGAVTTLGTRDCSVQRRHQKLIEIAPAPHLAPDLSRALCDAAKKMAEDVSLRGVATFEFLVDETDNYYFIETNPRLQVEHTCTEEVLGIDLVEMQLAIANGTKLSELNLEDKPNGYAIQVRINAERLNAQGQVSPETGQLTRFELSHGPGIRVDSGAYVGYSVTDRYDSLLAKLIVHTPGSDFARALRKTHRALNECIIDGCGTSLGLATRILQRDEIANASLHTRFVDEHAEELVAGLIFSQPTVTVAPLSPDGAEAISAPLRGTVVSVDIESGQSVQRGQRLATLESMKMHHDVEASASGTVVQLLLEVGRTVDEGEAVAFIQIDADADETRTGTYELNLNAERSDLNEVFDRHALGLDENRPNAVEKRHKLGFRTARENVADLVDTDSFVEYGALAIAAQRRRRSVDDLMASTPADGMVAGIGTVNASTFGEASTRCAVLAYDYTVLAGTQGHMNHKKKDRLFELAAEWEIPTVFYTEGGGGRPGDVDGDDLIMAWLDLKTFTTWAELSGVAPRIAVNSGRCFAGNAVLFGCADITIATQSSNIGLGGPAMIEGGGLGKFRPEDIGPIDVQTDNGVVDVACKDEVEATALAKQVLGYFQGSTPTWECADQRRLRHHVPEDRLRVYDVRKIIYDLSDTGSVVELRPTYGIGMITAFVRIEGQPFGLIANDPRHLGGAIDSEGGDKGARFLQLCDTYGLPVVSLCDTPGYMVGPQSEVTAAVRRGSRLILASANLTVPLFTVVLRKGYGLGGQAMAGGSFHRPMFIAAWPTAEFGPMGLEGAVELGFRKELEATPTPEAREALFNELVGDMYARGKGVSVAQVFEIDAVIDPMDTRRWLSRSLKACGPQRRAKRSYVDVW